MINILKKELREIFRDKKSLSMMLIVPLMIPLIIIGMSYLFENNVNKDIKDYNKIGFAYELNETEKYLADSFKIDVVTGTKEELEKMYKEGKINLYVTKNNNHYETYGYENDTSSYAVSLISNYFEQYKSILQENYLINKNIKPDDVLNIITLSNVTLEEENFFGNYIVSYAFMFIMMAVTVASTYPATDTTAGEKERGTLETLLTLPISSKSIIIGKYISVAISSIVTGIISLILAYFSLMYAGSHFDIYNGVDITLNLGQVVFAGLIIVAYAFMISGICISIASRAKTFKEAQSALGPITLVSIFPGMIAFFLNVKSSCLLSMIPFINYTLLFDDVTKGSFSVLNIMFMFLSTFIIIALMLSIIIKQYKSEKVLF